MMPPHLIIIILIKLLLISCTVPIATTTTTNSKSYCFGMVIRPSAGKCQGQSIIHSTCLRDADTAQAYVEKKKKYYEESPEINSCVNTVNATCAEVSKSSVTTLYSNSETPLPTYYYSSSSLLNQSASSSSSVYCTPNYQCADFVTCQTNTDCEDNPVIYPCCSYLAHRLNQTCSNLNASLISTYMEKKNQTAKAYGTDFYCVFSNCYDQASSAKDLFFFSPQLLPVSSAAAASCPRQPAASLLSFLLSLVFFMSHISMV